MTTIKRFVFCHVCGKVELTREQYNYQMDRADSRWVCPQCHSTAEWYGEYYKCVDATCTGWADADGSDICNVCGRNQYELYCEKMEGNI